MPCEHKDSRIYCKENIMANAYFNIAEPDNEPILPYTPGSPEKATVKAAADPPELEPTWAS